MSGVAKLLKSVCFAAVLCCAFGLLGKTAEDKWGGWKKGELQIHFIHTGAGESVFYIFPDGTTMLCDCGDFPAITRIEYAVPVMPGPQRLAGDWVARYVQRVVPVGIAKKSGRPLIDYWFLTHYHDDHCGSRKWQSIKASGKPLPNCHRSGIALAAEELAFVSAIDRCWPDAPETVPPLPGFAAEHVTSVYKALQKRDNLQCERFQPGSDKQFVQKHNPADFPDFRILNITGNGKILCRNGEIRDLYARHLQAGKKINENSLSCGFLLTYGKFTYYAAGDFSGVTTGDDGKVLNMEDLLAAELPKVDAAKINHHGYRCMSEKIVQALAARTWFAAIANTRQISPDCLKRISNRKLYPGNRTIFPGVYAESRAKAEEKNIWFKDIAPETRGNGCHRVITVPPGGKEYTVTCIDASNEEMKITGVYRFSSGENR